LIEVERRSQPVSQFDDTKRDAHGYNPRSQEDSSMNGIGRPGQVVVVAHGASISVTQVSVGDTFCFNE
jgi:hypothetical protein